MDDVVKRIQFNHNGKNVSEILGGMDEEIFKNEEDYKIVAKTLIDFAEAPELAALLSTTLCLLTDLEMEKVSHLVEYLYKSLTLEQLNELRKMVIGVKRYSKLEETEKELLRILRDS